MFQGLGNWRESCQQEWPGAAERGHGCSDPCPSGPCSDFCGGPGGVGVGEGGGVGKGRLPLRVLPLHQAGEAGMDG